MARRRRPPHDEIWERPLDVHFDEGQAGDVRSTEADISRAQQLLGWQPATGLGDGLSQQVASMRPLSAYV